ncbi:glycosyltransferase family 4 protein [Aequorivita sp. CIP111184]|uniref:glycosyltransferase family 4 protein n=1 Tax=Aequorivita sp. CIP111184 TaxID=2211356 RepID=UPI000DBBE1E1|nr:glycosyltransferase family 4 protein [Aequorivita sp. CIP111184]SRX55331.1 2-deoxystreptamine glucosyltransferase [Aequorivita sp. CIP111184]
MKIGIILATCPGYSETFFNSKIKGLIENGMEVTLFCQKKEENFQLCPIVVAPKVSANPIVMTFYFFKEFLQLLPYLNRVLKFLKLEKKEGTSLIQVVKMLYLNAHLLKSKLDWLHFGFSTMAIGSETVAKSIGTKMAVSLRGFDIAVYPLKHPGCYRRLWRYVDKVHTISDDLLLLAKNHGLPESVIIEKITPAIDINLFQAPPQDFAQTDNYIFVTTGRLHWKKGFIHILEALALLKDKGYNFVYKIIGEGKEYERIAYAAYELGIKDRVLFLGRLSHQEVQATLGEADIYVQYSIQEGFCNSVLEAQAMGKLCVVSDAEGLPENVLHAKTGWVVPKHSPVLLAQRLVEIIELNSDEKLAISRNASRRVREEFNIEKQQKKFVDFIMILTSINNLHWFLF